MDLIKQFNVNLDNKQKKVKEVLLRLETLSEPDQIILGLYADKQSYSETAKELGVSKTAVIKRIARIRRILLNEDK